MNKKISETVESHDNHKLYTVYRPCNINWVQ